MAKKILLAEDNSIIRQLYRFILEKSGYEVFEAESGVECLEAVQELKPDLVVLDLMMPVMGGCDVLQALRERSRAGDMPVIMVSLSGTAEQREKAMELGAKSFLVKDPDLPALLLDRIRSTLG